MFDNMGLSFCLSTLSLSELSTSFNFHAALELAMLFGKKMRCKLDCTIFVSRRSPLLPSLVLGGGTLSSVGDDTRMHFLAMAMVMMILFGAADVRRLVADDVVDVQCMPKQSTPCKAEGFTLKMRAVWVLVLNGPYAPCRAMLFFRNIKLCNATYDSKVSNHPTYKSRVFTMHARIAMSACKDAHRYKYAIRARRVLLQTSPLVPSQGSFLAVYYARFATKEHNKHTPSFP